MGSGSQGTGVVFEFEQAAMRGEELPRGLNVEDQMMFLSLRSLYHQVRTGLIPRETGIAEKKELVRIYNDAKRVNAFGEKCMAHSVQMWKELEGLKSEFRKDPSVELGIRLVNVMDGKLEGVFDG